MLWMPIPEFSLNVPQVPQAAPLSILLLPAYLLVIQTPTFHSFMHHIGTLIDRSSGCQCGKSPSAALWGSGAWLQSVKKAGSINQNTPPLCVFFELHAMLHLETSYVTSLMEYPQKPLIVHWAHWAINGFYEGVARWTKWTVFVQEVPNLASKDWVNGPKRASPIRRKGNHRVWSVLKRRQLLILNYSPSIFTGWCMLGNVWHTPKSTQGAFS